MKDSAQATDIDSWIAARPELKSLRVAVCDLNGCYRGKRVPVEGALKSLRDGIRMPLTLSAQDIWGRDIVDNPALEAGDGDGIARPTGRAPLDVDWLERPSALMPLWMFTEDGRPSPTDPRQVLARVVERAARAGLTAVVGTELEFHLIDASDRFPAAPISPATGRRLMADGVHAVDDLDGFDAFFDRLYAAAGRSGVPVDAAIAEGSPGQFEVTLRHQADILKAADDAQFLKRLVRGIARQHGLAATFMAKPYQDYSGNGFHVHMSLLDRDGRNMFDDGTPQGSAMLRHAVAGCLGVLEPLTLIFAPHLNSYRRLAPGSHAPSFVSWAHENRYAALRIPGGPGYSRRLEHRVSGADANPYLVLAVVLGAALDGIEAGREPPPALVGNPLESDLPQLTGSWEQAITAFRDSDAAAALLGPEMATIFGAAKAQEWERFTARMSEFELQSYLEVV
ncbi:glutamine synthetase [Halovulum dunhuangense]|uniref:Glutamine synthetase n=1 Tax=Halovulum dunhuangense TaxID=1505036 RepID=A0A849L0P1_9RHOB|nr:glutamine synthetase family protein [Halovulum dunhuangense]NNU79846.1 glutamine synthetase [Halovulum dunhuangense]